MKCVSFFAYRSVRICRSRYRFSGKLCAGQGNPGSFPLEEKIPETHASHRQDPRGGRRAAAGTGAADQLRERFWKQIAPFYEIASGQEQNVAELTRGLYEFLTELQLEEQIHQAQEAFEEAGRGTPGISIPSDLQDCGGFAGQTGGSAGRRNTFRPGLCRCSGRRVCVGKSVRFRREQTV